MAPTESFIALRGVRVHNLQGIDLDLPLGKLIVFTGVSGAGKSSLAFDTLYAEGQRRYVESFPTFARQFLERIEPPEVDSISPLPPAVAVRQGTAGNGRRATLSTVTELHDHLRVLYARAGRIVCPGCRLPVVRASPASVTQWLTSRTGTARIQIGFPIFPRGDSPAFRDDPRPDDESSRDELSCRLERLAQAGFTRAVLGDKSTTLREVASRALGMAETALAIVDRLTVPVPSHARLTDSLETAFRMGSGACVVLTESAPDNSPDGWESPAGRSISIDGQPWRLWRFDEQFVCAGCLREFPELEPAHFSFQSPLGACPRCRGLGVVDFSTAELDARQGTAAKRPVRKGRSSEPSLSAPGVSGNDRDPNRPICVCPECLGTRMQPLARAVEIAGLSLPSLTAMTVDDAHTFLRPLHETLAHSAPLSARLLPAVVHRLELLRNVGLGYLTLDRPMRTLSRGEAQRARIAGACGAHLVNILYVFDEPTAGLHPRDTRRLVDMLRALRDAGNTLVVVEHDPVVISCADQIIDLGPQAGAAGGRVMYQGPPSGLADCPDSTTASFLSRRTGQSTLPDRRMPTGWLRLENIHHHNLRGVSVAFPLGLLCVVTGVSGSGKSSLVVDTLLPAVRRALAAREGSGIVEVEGRRSGGETEKTERGRDRERERQRDGEKEELRDATWHEMPVSPSLPLSVSHSSSFPSSSLRTSTTNESTHWGTATGVEQLDALLHLDAAPIGRSPRSQSASYLGVFGEIRKLFAETAEAKVQNLSARHFSFNAAGGGGCETCRGSGSVAVDMQFLPDVVVPCPDCHGTRFRREILAVKYRGLSIAEVLALTARDAFAFFRGRTRIQRRLKSLKEVGLEYLPLGQPARTLSGGESQRLKLAAFLSQGRRGRTLIVLEEPTSGLHPQDVGRLLEAWNTLRASGHSLLVIEHNLEVIRRADHIIDLGPDAGAAGGCVVAAGTPEEISREPASITGRFLREASA